MNFAAAEENSYINKEMKRRIGKRGSQSSSSPSPL